MFASMQLVYSQEIKTPKTETKRVCCKAKKCKKSIVVKENIVSDTTKVIEFDFKTKKFTNANNPSEINLKKGDLFQIKVSNINQNLYEVIIDKKDSLKTSNLTFPAIDLIGLGSVNSLLANIATSAFSSISANSFVADLAIPIKKEDKNKVEKVTSFLEIRTLTSDSLNKALNVFIAKTEADIKNLTVKFNESNTLLINIENQLMSYYVSPTNDEKTKSDFSEKKLTYIEMLKKADELNTEMDNIQANIKSVKSEIDAYLKDLLKEQNNVDFLKKDTLSRGYIADMNKNYSKIFESIKEAKEKISYTKISGYYKTIVFLENNSDNDYNSMPLQLTGDVSTINLKIVPKSTDFKLPIYNAVYQLPKNLTYIGAGTSLYYARFQSSVFNVRETKTSDTTSFFNLVDENNPKGEIGINTLLHVGSKFRCKNQLFGYHLVVGPAVSVSAKPQLRLAAGAGLSLGKNNNMLSFDVLSMFGYTNTLSKVYDLNQNYNVKPVDFSISKLSKAIGFAFGYIYKF